MADLVVQLQQLLFACKVQAGVCMCVARGAGSQACAQAEGGGGMQAAKREKEGASSRSQPYERGVVHGPIFALLAGRLKD